MCSWNRINKVLLVVIFIICIGMPSETAAGWFGPENTKECTKKYKDRANTYDTYNTMLIGCQLWFEHNNEKFGKCMLEYFEKVKSSSGTIYLSAACDLLSQNKYRSYHKGAECMLRHVNKITDENSKMFYINIKCDLDLENRTTTTHEESNETTYQ